MALSKIVSKVSVILTQPKCYTITFNLKVNDGENEVINKDFQTEYRSGENIADKVASMIEQMQAVINAYKAEQVIFNSTPLNNAVTAIEGGLTL